MCDLFVLLVPLQNLCPWQKRQHKGWKIPGLRREVEEEGALAHYAYWPMSKLKQGMNVKSPTLTLMEANFGCIGLYLSFLD
jgi:hypothetical protein